MRVPFIRIVEIGSTDISSFVFWQYIYTLVMDKFPTIARGRIRRLYYLGAVVLLLITIGSFTVPAFLRVHRELETKIEQLSESIIDDKKLFLRSIIIEKIREIERIRERLESEEPSLPAGEFDSLFRAEVRDLIYTTELPDDGYIWINEILDFGGGDGYAIRFVHPNLMESEGELLSTHTPDSRGNLPYLEELEGIKSSGEAYIDYYFVKMHSDVISHKLSFTKLYEPYNWVVATGVYLDDVDRLVRSESEKMRLSTKRTLRGSV